MVSGLTTTAIAQRVVPETPRVSPLPVPPGGGSSGVGGGAGLIAPMPRALTLPEIAAPPVVAPAAPAVVAPAAPARVVRFRCEVAPQDQTCRDPGAGDGGGDDAECNCARDYCHTTEAGSRVCEKLQ